MDEIAHLYCTLNNKIGCLKICRIIPPHDRVNKVVSLFWPQLFKCWIALSIGYITIHWITIRETNCTIHCIEIYMVDSAIHLLNKWGPVLFHSLSFHFSFALHYSHNDYFEMETDWKRLKIELIQTTVKSTKLGCKHVTNKIVLAQLILFASPLEKVLV